MIMLVCMWMRSVQNSMAEWIARLAYIREVQGSNLGPEIGRCMWDALWFASVLPAKLNRDSILKLAQLISVWPSQLIIH
jgi:hypothetical protein